jgi:hypothetical protein
MSRQQAANDAWVAYQQQAQQKELAADEAARQTALTDVNAGAQKKHQLTEEARLTQRYTPQSIKQQGNDPNQTPGDLPDGSTASIDIAQLDTASLLAWLRSAGGNNSHRAPCHRGMAQATPSQRHTRTRSR